MNEPNEIIAEQVAGQVHAQQATIGQGLTDAGGVIAEIGGEIVGEEAVDTVIEGAVDVAGDLLGGIFDLF